MLNLTKYNIGHNTITTLEEELFVLFYEEEDTAKDLKAIYYCSEWMLPKVGTSNKHGLYYIYDWINCRFSLISTQFVRGKTKMKVDTRYESMAGRLRIT